MSSAKNVVESFREAIQDLLVPEMKAVKVSVDSLRSEMKIRHDSMDAEMKLRYENLSAESKLRYSNLEQLIKSSDERNERSIRTLSDKIDFSNDVRLRLATLEARMPKQ